jgi:hypothetical protein
VKKEKAKAQNNKVKTKPQVEKEVNNTPMPIIQIGSRVKIDKSKNLGTVEAIDTKNKTAVVVSGILKFTMPLDRLTVII